MLRKKIISMMLAFVAAGTIVSCGAGGGTSTPTTSTEPPVSESVGTSNSVEEPTSVAISTEDPAETYTVTFYDDGRVYGEPVVVTSGETVSKPSDPTREGTEFVNYNFKGWFEAGKEEAFDFTTPITSNLDLYSSFEEIARNDYDLVVAVYGINGASSPTTYITEEESKFMYDTFVYTLAEEKNILWHYSTGLKNDNFNNFVNTSKTPIDVVISGNKLDNGDTDSIAVHETYKKVHLGDGWIENTSRYLAITQYCSAEHLDLATKVYTMLSSIGPKYMISLDAESASMQIGDTKQLTATYYGTQVVWESDNEAVATVADGLVTAIAEGTANITAKDIANNVATCKVEVTAAPIVPEHDLVIVLNNSNASNNWMSEEDANDLVSAFTAEGQPGYGKDVKLHVVSGVNIAGVVTEIEEINKNDLARVDAALCRSAFFTNKACPTMLENGTIYDVDSTWGYSGGQFGVFANAFAEHVELANAFGTFVSNKNIDFFEIEETVTVKISETHQLTTVEGATYVSGDENIATVSETGLITPVAIGATSISVEKGYYEAIVSLTVSPDEQEAVTINIYVHLAASKTTYMPEENFELLKAHVEATISETITINWTTLSGVNNAGVTSAIDEAEETVHMGICAKASMEGTAQGINESTPAVKINSQYPADGESRYVAALNGISAVELAACLEVYNAVKA